MAALYFPSLTAVIGWVPARYICALLGMDIFTVAVFSWQREKLEEQGALEVLFEGSVYVLADGFYRDHTGLALEAQLLPY